MGFKKYNLSETQLKQIARLCVQEQGGGEAGTKAEASQGANLLETNSTYQKKFGDDIWRFFRDSGWYYKASHFFENGSASAKQIEWVRDVLCNGNRTLDGYVDEHDAMADVASVSNHGKTFDKRDKSQYIKDVTIIKNKMGSTYTFYCFPGGINAGTDGFGYTQSAYNKVMANGGSPTASSSASTPIDNITLNESVKYKAYVTADSLNVRMNCGTEFDKCSFSPLSYGTDVGVCHDSIKGTDGGSWSYILVGEKHGFVSGKYLSKTNPVATENTDAPQTNSFGDPIDKVLNIAFNEVGYLEKASNSNLDSKTGNAGDKNYTKYARDCFPDLQGLAWCGMFSEWCLVQAFGKSTANKMVNGLSADCDEIAQNFKDAGRWYKTPKKGDLILFIKNGDDYYHVGLVYDVTNSTVYTVEGNTSAGSQVIPNGGAVCKKSYALGNSKIGGYGRPNYSLVAPSSNTTTPSKQTVSSKIPSTTLKKGDNGKAVEEMQRMLNMIGYSLTVDGDYGVKTEAAVKSFQKANGLSVNGRYGANTSEALRKACSFRPTAADITVDEFLSACKQVMDRARTKGYKYGDSHAIPPTSDGIISCDRLIAAALYQLGFTDQRQGGETCGTLDGWLKSHGFARSTKASSIKKGSILLVKHEGKSYISHAFVVRKYNSSNWLTDRYDSGSNDRIKTVQPLKNVSWGYQKSNFIVYNIPA